MKRKSVTYVDSLSSAILTCKRLLLTLSDWSDTPALNIDLQKRASSDIESLRSGISTYLVHCELNKPQDQVNSHESKRATAKSQCRTSSAMFTEKLKRLHLAPEHVSRAYEGLISSEGGKLATGRVIRVVESLLSDLEVLQQAQAQLKREEEERKLIRSHVSHLEKTSTPQFLLSLDKSAHGCDIEPSITVSKPQKSVMNPAKTKETQRQTSMSSSKSRNSSASEKSSHSGFANSLEAQFQHIFSRLNASISNGSRSHAAPDSITAEPRNTNTLIMSSKNETIQKESGTARTTTRKNSSLFGGDRSREESLQQTTTQAPICANQNSNVNLSGTYDSSQLSSEPEVSPQIEPSPAFSRERRLDSSSTLEELQPTAQEETAVPSPTTPLSDEDNVVFLCYKRKIRPVSYKEREEHIRSLNDVKSLFVKQFGLENFSLSEHVICYKHPVVNDFFELEDLSHFKPGCILRLEAITDHFPMSIQNKSVTFSQSHPTVSHHYVQEARTLLRWIKHQHAGLLSAIHAYKSAQRHQLHQVSHQLQEKLQAIISEQQEATCNSSRPIAHFLKAMDAFETQVSEFKVFMDVLRSDLTRGVHPGPLVHHYLESEANSLQQAYEDLFSQLDSTKRRCKQVWEQELQRIMQEQAEMQSMREQVDSIRERPDFVALKDVLDTVTEVLQLQLKSETAINATGDAMIPVPPRKDQVHKVTSFIIDQVLPASETDHLAEQKRRILHELTLKKACAPSHVHESTPEECFETLEKYERVRHKIQQFEKTSLLGQDKTFERELATHVNMHSLKYLAGVFNIEKKLDEKFRNLVTNTNH